MERLKAAGAAISRPLKGVGLDATLGALFGERGFSEAAVIPAEPPSRDARLKSGLARPKAGPKLGFDREGMDLTVRPQDDFFRYANGVWLKTFKMPADKSTFGSFDSAHDRSEAAVKTIIEEAVAAPRAAGTDAQRIADLYRSFMDTEEIEARGLKPLARDLKRIDAIPSKAMLPRVFARGLAAGVDGPVGFGIGQDSKAPTQHAASIGQSGLGLPDRDYYFQEGADAEKIRAKYVEYLGKLFTLAGEADAPRKAEAVFALEKALAEHQWTAVQNRDADKTYNKVAVDDLAALAPGFAWRDFFRAAGVGGALGTILVDQPSYLTGMARVLADTPLETWKLYLKIRTLDAATPYLQDAFVQASFEFKGRTLNGQPEMRPRWKRAVRLVDEAVGEAVGKLYAQRHFPESSKARMAGMVENLRAAYAERIKAVPWMGPETKAKALEKLAKFATKIGYPDRWRDYSGLAVQPKDLLGNVRRSNRLDYRRMLAKLGKPVDRREWMIHPQTVNAYYHPVMNEIVFPAAILQAPFFDPEADDAINYGAIGAIIGHEMSHGFDDEGSKFDGDGALKDWWTPKDRAEFEARADKLVAQFDAYEPLPGKHVNGRLTLGENIGDLGGMTVAYEAYRLSLKGREAAVIQGFTGDQRFFLGWAQAWRGATRDEALAMQMATDPHSPDIYRVNGVAQNMPAFYRAFGLKPGDKLYLPPEHRVAIW